MADGDFRQINRPIAATDFLVGVQPGTADLSAGGTRSTARELFNLLLTTAGLPLALIGTELVTFDDAAWKVSGIVIPAGTSWLAFGFHHARLRGTRPIQLASIWRGLPEIGHGDDATEANRMPLAGLNLPGAFHLSAGRGPGSAMALQFDGGHAGMAGANVEVWGA